ncbi:hypothetical protein QUC30_13030 [Aeromonas caviae]|uniref:hypothetical protein n=1 Tax=Aeromonas caviae TaxID=648 RepID=UPI003D2F02E5
MMKVLAVMTYFQISLPTHNWDSAYKEGASSCIKPVFCMKKPESNDRGALHSKRRFIPRKCEEFVNEEMSDDSIFLAGVLMFDSKLKKELAAERETALKSEALDHAMHDHLPMIEFTTDGYILDASPLFLHSVGYSLNEIVQQHHAMFCMKEDTDSPSYREFWRDLANGHSQHGTFHTGLANKARKYGWKPPIFPSSQGKNNQDHQNSVRCDSAT